MKKYFFLFLFLIMLFSFIPLIHGLEEWLSPNSFLDPDAAWSSEPNAYDDDAGTFAVTSISDIAWSSYLYLNFTEVTGNKLRYWVDRGGVKVDDMEIDVLNTTDSNWYNVHAGIVVGSFQNVTFSSTTSDAMRIRFYHSQSGKTQDAEVYEMDFLNVTVEENNAPTNDQCSITDLDDTDDLYAQKQLYTIDYDVSDLDGFSDIDYCEVRLKQGASTRAIFRYDEDTDTFSVESGGSEWSLDGSSSAIESGTYINVTMKIAAQWDAIEEADLEIECYVVDDEPESDTDTMQTDYFDVITNLVTNNIECTDANDPDRVDVSSSIQIDFSVRYVDEPASSTPSSFYPPNAEFTSISVYDSLNNNEGTDSTIENGAGSVTFNAESSVKSEDYNLYIDMVDADYSDGEESTTETVISDQMEIVSIAFDDSRVNIGASVEVRYVLRYDYDDVSFTGTDGSIVGFTWDGSNSWWDKSVNAPGSPSSENYDENDLGALTDNNYILTVYEDDLGADLIGDRIKVLTITSNNTSPNVDEYVELRVTLELEYDSHALDDGTNDVVNLVDASSPSMSWDAGDSRWEVDDVRASPIAVTYDEVTGSEDTYGITAINMNGKSVVVTWGAVGGYYYLTVYFEDGLNVYVNASLMVNASENQYDQDTYLNMSSEPLNTNWEFFGFERVTYTNFTMDNPIYLDLISNETVWVYSQIEGEPLLYETVLIFSLLWVCLLGFFIWNRNELLRGGTVLVGFILGLTIHSSVATTLGSLLGFVVVCINVGLLVSVLFEK